jgi:hypothetical protein
MAGLPRPVRAMSRWTVAVPACLVIFAGSWWAWEALKLPPAGPDRLAVALAVAAALSAAFAGPLYWWAGAADASDQPRGYLCRVEGDDLLRDLYPITPGKWLIGRERRLCPIAVPDNKKDFPGVGRTHARLICDSAGFAVESLHQNGTYVNGKVIPQQQRHPVGFDDVISLAGPPGSKPNRCVYKLTAQPMPWPSASATDNDSKSEYVTILTLMSDPVRDDKLAFDEELRAMQQVLIGARYGSQVSLELLPAPGLSGLGSALLTHHPAIVHVTGRGGGEEGGIALAAAPASPRPASAQELGDFFLDKAPLIRCVFLNGCYTREVGLAIARHVECVIGTPRSFPDDAALLFAMSFYQALANGQPIGTAFSYGTRVVRQMGLSSRKITPVIHARSGAKRQHVTS